MLHSTENRATIGRVLVLGFLLATLLSTIPAGAAVPSSKAFAWGENFAGQLGNGNTGTDSHVPVAVKNLTGVKRVKAGGYHGLALLEDGTVYAWGYNGFGELGNGSNAINSNVPVKVANLTGVKAISAGQNFSLALMENGSVRSWGYDIYGQLGNGDANANQHVPVNVENLSGVSRISAPELGFHALALKKNGDVFFWGTGPDGDATEIIEQANVPVKVQNVSNVKSIDAGHDFSLFLMQDGTVKGLGENGYGQLGDGSFEGKGEPVAVKDLTNVRAISAGRDHALALNADGTVMSWGSDYAGQLGDGPDIGNAENEPDNVGKLSGIESVSAGYRTSFASR